MIAFATHVALEFINGTRIVIPTEIYEHQANAVADAEKLAQIFEELQTALVATETGYGAELEAKMNIKQFLGGLGIRRVSFVVLQMGATEQSRIIVA